MFSSLNLGSPSPVKTNLSLGYIFKIFSFSFIILSIAILFGQYVYEPQNNKKFFFFIYLFSNFSFLILVTPFSNKIELTL